MSDHKVFQAMGYVSNATIELSEGEALLTTERKAIWEAYTEAECPRDFRIKVEHQKLDNVPQTVVWVRLFVIDGDPADLPPDAPIQPSPIQKSLDEQIDLYYKPKVDLTDTAEKLLAKIYEPLARKDLQRMYEQQLLFPLTSGHIHTFDKSIRGDTA